MTYSSLLRNLLIKFSLKSLGKNFGFVLIFLKIMFLIPFSKTLNLHLFLFGQYIYLQVYIHNITHFNHFIPII